MRITIIVALAVLILLPSYVRAASVDRVLKDLKARYSDVETLSAAFTQTVSMKGAKTGETSQGKVWFKRPGRMRWIYESPVKDEFIGNGKTIWAYQPDLNQVVEKQVDATFSSIAVDFLGGMNNIEKEFEITLAKAGPDAYLLNLLPRQPQAGAERVTVRVDRKTGLVIETTVEDIFGSSTVVGFTDIRTNKPVADSFFEFAIPKGATVVRP
ncbi:MAG: outer membrane lipoprotein chaperone LolA [Deltaproteobacteria bacterium]|nr:outer membrane lipoprotein chaperone LolA [Deltaproteobacteria bacterium]